MKKKQQEGQYVRRQIRVTPEQDKVLSKYKSNGSSLIRELLNRYVMPAFAVVDKAKNK